MARTLSNPETFEGRLYLPNGDMHLVPYVASRSDYQHMDEAIREAEKAVQEGNPAVGAVLVTGKGKYAGHSTEITDNDLRNHAEMNAYGKAKEEVGLHMPDSMWFSTMEPCQMCIQPIIQGESGSLFYAVERDEAPDYFRKKQVVLDTILRDAGRTILVVAGIRKVKALELLTPKTKRH